MNEIAWDKLCGCLSSLQPGPVGDASQIKELLIEYWDELGGSDFESTAAYKLRRAEDIQWDPPNLSFILERHGGTCQGSTRAARHLWVVDVQAKQVTCNPRHSHRQVRPMAKRVYTKLLAEELVAVIVGRKDDDRLKWSKNYGQVRVILKTAVGATAKRQTREDRSHKLRDELIRVLPEYGWYRVGNTGAEFEFKDSR